LYCPKCGVELRANAKFCHKCGSRVNLNVLPQRMNRSPQDRVKEQASRRREAGFVPSVVMSSWENVFKSTPSNLPYYTALNGRACIVIHFYQIEMVPDDGILKETLRRPLNLYVMAFLKGSYPIMRFNLEFNSPIEPLMVECPLNIRNGDFQDFYYAAIADEHVDLIAKHDSSDSYYALAYHAPGIASTLEREVSAALEAFNPTLTEEDFNASVNVMEKTYRSVEDGVNIEESIELTLVGKAKNSIIDYRIEE